MNEEQILAKLKRRLGGAQPAGVVAGIGDDCAIIRPRGSKEDLVITTDLVLEDVHFRATTHSAEDVGHKVLARGLSDLAAMGAEPRYCFVSLAAASEEWIDGFYRGFLRLARRAGIALLGGDLARDRRVAADIVAVGAVPRGTALLRSKARVGDQIWVSGRLGGSALGLRDLETGVASIAAHRHRRPEPRLALGRFLRETLRASAAMDLSDGLSLDLRRMCLASGVAANLDREPPRLSGATLDDALHGGEDYELLYAVRPGAAVPAKLGRVALTKIGTFVKGTPGQVLLCGEALPARGWDHFRS